MMVYQITNWITISLFFCVIRTLFIDMCYLRPFLCNFQVVWESCIPASNVAFVMLQVYYLRDTTIFMKPALVAMHLIIKSQLR